MFSVAYQLLILVLLMSTIELPGYQWVISLLFVGYPIVVSGSSGGYPSFINVILQNQLVISLLSGGYHWFVTLVIL